MASSPTVARMEFSLIVRERRHELKLSAETVAKQLGFSRVYYSSIENSRALPSEEKLDAFIDVLRLEGADADELRDLSRRARERAWWHHHPHITANPVLADAIGLEHGATNILAHETRILSGLLQTQAYAEAAFSVDPRIAATDRQALVDIRLRRQARLADPASPKLEVILAESILHQVWGSRGVLRDQLAFLLSMLEERPDKISMVVQPFDRTPGGFSGTSTLMLLTFGDSRLAPVGYQESHHADGQFLTGAEQLRGLDVHLEQAHSLALTKEESVDLLRRRLNELR